MLSQKRLTALKEFPLKRNCYSEIGAEGVLESFPDALASGSLLSLFCAEESTAAGGLSRFSNKLFEEPLFPAKTAKVKLVMKKPSAQ